VDALDHPIWTALTTRQSDFAEVHGIARRFSPEVTQLAAIEKPSAYGFESLAALVTKGKTAGLITHERFEWPEPFTVIAEVDALQMVQWHEPALDSVPPVESLVLGPQDVEEMVALARMTEPGPFGNRTRELGHYIGIRRQGTLAAMTGERMRVPGFTEVSAVCTHPDHTGRGYAAALVATVANRIRARGETPFLHVRADNSRAIQLYQRLGFVERARPIYAVVRCGSKE
jgi:predicted GNAT family acetyltransferase